ncbi:ATP synthase E chain-domain-containing protein [Chytriomyces sp. MP71]|nr:ATP synthase E chain-domain-containing protein [Chytriomyces sp. MP71]
MSLNVASVNIARWGALAVGVFYGYTRQRSLTLHVKEQNEEKEFRHYADLVEEAKVAFEAAYNREQAAKAAPLGS